MTIRFNTLFQQRDVRLTPSATATATAVGLTDGKYVVTDYHADMTDERKLAVNTSDLSLSDAGAGSTITLALANKTSYLSIPGTAFFSALPASQAVQKSQTYQGAMKNISGGTILAVVPVMLPHGAVVTGVIVYMNVATRTWLLYRSDSNETSTGQETMATAVTNTEDTSISNATIDNSAKKYFITIESIANNEIIAGARITYTTDYN